MSKRNKQELTLVAIQPNFIPWRGYFDLIDDADICVLLDDVQYTHRDWRNRNKLKGSNGSFWVTVPVSKNVTRSTLIMDTKINYSQDWIQTQLVTIEQLYSKCPHFTKYYNRYSEILHSRPTTICDLDTTLITWLCTELGITTKLLKASTLGARPNKADGILYLVKQLDATRYISGPAASSYLKQSDFETIRVLLLYKCYDYEPYPQRFPPFDSAVSVLDLLFNCGTNSRQHLKSLTPPKTADQLNMES